MKVTKLYICSVDSVDLVALVADLRVEGGDFAGVEVKRARHGFPERLAPTISAFANTPGGGLLVFGLDEKAGFEAVGVFDVRECKTRVASLARQGVSPPVTVEIVDRVFEGVTLVLAEVHESPGSDKPCRVASTKKAYLRAHDGDYELSQVEEQAFLANRSTPRFDQAAVQGAQRSDLDASLVASYIDSCRSTSSALSRFPDDEILRKTGLITEGSTPTVAGLLSLGSYPQQFFPNAVIQAAVLPGSGSDPAVRALDQRRFDGAIPVMLEESLRWVQRNTRTLVRFGEDGHGRDEPEYPALAVRELLANALVHRDLGPYALTEAITLRIQSHELLISNPGGLWGLTADRLGKVAVSSARNGWLVRACQNVRFNKEQRVVEALASGIPAVLSSLRRAGMVEPRFHDQGIRFTVRVPNHTLLAADDLRWLADLPPGLVLTDTQRHLLVAMRHGAEWTNRSLRDAFPMDSRESHRVLQELVTQGAAQAQGERGGRTYSLARDLGGRAVDQQEPLWRDDVPSGSERRDLPVVAAVPAVVSNREVVVALLRTGPRSVNDLVEASALSERQVRYALGRLRERGDVVLRGGTGKRDSQYELVESRPV